MQGESTKAGQGKPTTGSKGQRLGPAISNGKLLASADGRGSWARYFADTLSALLSHAGGEASCQNEAAASSAAIAT